MADWRVGMKVVCVRYFNPHDNETLPVVDKQLGVDTPNGEFWHRYNYDGYGETLDGGMFSLPGNRGRLWPIFAGERAEYELYSGLSHAAVCASASSDDDRQHVEALVARHRQLEDWARHCPENFESGAQLLAAEVARIEGRDAEANCRRHITITTAVVESANGSGPRNQPR